MSALPYDQLPAYPPRLDAPGVLARLVDGLGYRYRWATEGLHEEDLSFSPCEGAFTLRKVLRHMHWLIAWVQASVDGAGEEPPDRAPQGWEELRADTLGRLVALRTRLVESTPEQLAEVTITGDPGRGTFPIWNAVNGPLADFLTHVGQVSSWRRMAGNPVSRADVFRGR